MLWLLIFGVLMWSLVHLFPAIMPEKRAELIGRLGNGKYQGLFALAIFLSLILIVIGWRGSIPQTIYEPLAIGRHVTLLLVLFSIILLGASHTKSWLKENIRHPMLSGVAVWGIAHLLSNGDSRSVVLFGGMLIWALLSIHFINKRDGLWKKPEMKATLKDNLMLVGIGVVVYLVLVFLHPWFAGMSLRPH